MIEIPQFVRDLIDLRCSTSAKLRPSAWFIGQHPELGPFLDALVSLEPWYRCREDALKLLCLGFMEPARCLRCGRELDQDRLMKNSALRFCSKRCSQSSPERLAKVRATSLARFGVENAMQSDAVKERNAATNLARYGVANVFQSEAIKEKSRTTMLEKYGAENFSMTEAGKEKIKATNLERYGVEFVSQSEEVRRKIVATNRERYGGIAPACSRDVVEKMKATCRERYGVDFFHQSREFIDSEYERLITLFKDIVEPLFTKEAFHGVIAHEELPWKCKKCGTEFNYVIHQTHLKGLCQNAPRCPKCFPYLGISSKCEHEVADFIRLVVGDKERIERGYRKIPTMNGKEVDVFLQSRNFAVEFDGMFWHTEIAGKKDSFYHLFKTEACEKAGIRLIHVFEDEWRDRRSLVEDRIKSALGIYGRRIHARKCLVRELSAIESNAFLDENHLQGGDRSSVRLGLFLEDELVAVMTFGRPRFDAKYDWELIRYASRLGTQVVGGAGKLLAHFRKSHAGSVVSYADRRWSVGGLYAALGFRLVGTSRPNYWYVRGTEKHSRYECQKHRLPALLGDAFDPLKSEAENMSLAGFDRIYDCGNLVYVLEEEQKVR